MLSPVPTALRIGTSSGGKHCTRSPSQATAPRASSDRTAVLQKRCHQFPRCPFLLSFVPDRPAKQHLGLAQIGLEHPYLAPGSAPKRFSAAVDDKRGPEPFAFRRKPSVEIVGNAGRQAPARDDEVRVIPGIGKKVEAAPPIRYFDRRAGKDELVLIAVDNSSTDRLSRVQPATSTISVSMRSCSSNARSPRPDWPPAVKIATASPPSSCTTLATLIPPPPGLIGGRRTAQLLGWPRTR